VNEVAGPWTRRHIEAMEVARRMGAVEARSDGREVEEGTKVRGSDIAEWAAGNRNANVDALARPGCSTLF
jgi:hypothetical protein